MQITGSKVLLLLGSHLHRLEDFCFPLGFQKEVRRGQPVWLTCPLFVLGPWPDRNKFRALYLASLVPVARFFQDLKFSKSNKPRGAIFGGNESSVLFKVDIVL